MSKKTVAEQIVGAIKSKRVPLSSRDIAQLTALSLSSVKNGLWRLQAKDQVFVVERARVKGATQRVRLYSTVRPKSKRIAEPKTVVKPDPVNAAVLTRAVELGGPFGILIAQLEVRHGA